MNVKFGKRLIRRTAIGFSVWKHLTTKLKEYGFSINPYDLCDSNNMFQGKQCTILWDVDDINNSCQQKSDRMMTATYGNDAQLNNRRYKMHGRP